MQDVPEEWLGRKDFFLELERESSGRQVVISSGREAPKGLAKKLSGT